MKFVDERGVEGLAREFERHGRAEGVYATISADPTLQYDAATVITRSVLQWDPPRAAPIAEGSELQLWLAREIVYFSRPDLAPSPEAGDAA